MSIPITVMKELIELPAKDWPTCHLAQNGRYYSHDGDGQWDEHTGKIYNIVGTPEQKAKLRKLLAGGGAESS